MFRATQMASEETLPALGLLTINDDNETIGITTSLTLKNGSNKKSGYGLVTVLHTHRRPKYPIAIIFVLTAKLFEAFAANGIRTILALYLRDDLFFSESFSTVLLHIFNFFGQFCPIFGAILADSYIGNVRTINRLYFVYALGWTLLVFTSLPYVGVSLVFLVSMALLLIAIGNGSTRACVTSLGAIQFQLPDQAKQLADYFSWYYFIYYIGIFLSKIIPPMIRANTRCYNKTECYPAVFGTLGTSFFMAWLTFTIGKLFYKEEKIAEENILVKFYGCVKHALSKKWNRASNDKKPAHWLHYAIGRYDEAFVNDVTKIFKLVKLYIPLPIYFALLAQQDSSWTFQAAFMNTTIVEGITIQPDQAKAMGPIFLFMLIPLWQYVVQPLLRWLFKLELQPLQSVTVGGVFSALSFISAGILQRYIYTRPYRSVNVLWQIPQFIFIMLGELLLSIPGLQFAFTQAPVSMKSVVTAAWFLNNAFGNLIVVLITELNIFPSQYDEFFFYAILMIVSIIFYTYLAYVYVLDEQVAAADSVANDSNHNSLELISSEKPNPRNGVRVSQESDRNDDTPSTSNITIV
ncbi:solute carrier family 15 member 2 [Stomoxys calcitrans]|uniref:solute carrier family 15 member 2 n=1 Tax=Stomoxys calcitrans TaxID=35570 RepID=UPI0027E311C2|nr:solute carrier family 15 member 2 [Stomoxys calcitrans]